jgi:hypothetical protein
MSSGMTGGFAGGSDSSSQSGFTGGRHQHGGWNQDSSQNTDTTSQDTDHT